MQHDKGTRELKCRDFGVDCDFVARGKTDDEVIKKGSEHGCKVHGQCSMTPEQEKKARSLIKTA